MLRRRLVWLETLDMEPLGGSEANLLGAVLARVEEAVSARFPGRDDAAEPVSLLHPGAGYHDMSRELGRLQTSVALTFHGNLDKRSGSLDPDTFAVESRRAERERLGLDRRFAGVMAGLSSAMASTIELEAPVFVLPVDDVDLNVGDCVPLLRLLRATSSPHLIVVLAADVVLLSTILRLNYQGDLARICTPVPLSPGDQGVAGDLAANAMRKHLPPAQRVVLGLVEPGRALALKPLESAKDNLGQVLGNIELPADSATLQVASIFSPALADTAMQRVVTNPGWSAGSEEKPAEPAERMAPFSWPRVLQLPVRQLVDLYLDCVMRTEEQRQHRPLAHHVTDPPLVQLARERLQALRARIPGTRQAFGSVSGRLGTPVTTQSGEAPAVLRVPWHGWQISAESGLLDMAEVAVLVGCIELLGAQGADFNLDPSPPVAYLPCVRQTHWGADANGEGLVEWPWVTHSTFWGYERAMAWLTKAEKAWANQFDAAFGSWVAVMTAQLFDAPGQTQPFDEPTCALAYDWNSLAKRLNDLERTPLAETWLDAVGLLCTPEMGMTSLAVIPAFLPAWRAGHVQSLRDQRFKHLPPTLRELAMSWPQAAEQPEQAQPKPGDAAEQAGAARTPRARSRRPARATEAKDKS